MPEINKKGKKRGVAARERKQQAGLAGSGIFLIRGQKDGLNTGWKNKDKDWWCPGDRSLS
ncbi:MAG: hypothetical protein LBU79_01535 [Planctomycetota bacterium]|nr:hypothetical protein [Planctomycetota bacterium]